jgi:hypothetical protein
MHLDYALEGYWLSKRRGFSPHTVADYEVTFRRLLAFIGQDILGHEKLDTVRLYVKLADTDLLQAQASASPADRWGL